LILPVGYGGRGDVNTVIENRMNGEASPAGADFNDPVPRLELQLAADSIVFSNGILFEGAIILISFGRADAAAKNRVGVKAGMPHTNPRAQFNRRRSVSKAIVLIIFYDGNFSVADLFSATSKRYGG
jgi:hypothetical protein